jgi:hypothetical protein
VYALWIAVNITLGKSNQGLPWSQSNDLGDSPPTLGLTLPVELY